MKLYAFILKQSGSRYLLINYQIASNEIGKGLSWLSLQNYQKLSKNHRHLPVIELNILKQTYLMFIQFLKNKRVAYTHTIICSLNLNFYFSMSKDINDKMYGNNILNRSYNTVHAYSYIKPVKVKNKAVMEIKLKTRIIKRTYRSFFKVRLFQFVYSESTLILTVHYGFHFGRDCVLVCCRRVGELVSMNCTLSTSLEWYWDFNSQRNFNLVRNWLVHDIRDGFVHSKRYALLYDHLVWLVDRHVDWHSVRSVDEHVDWVRYVLDDFVWDQLLDVHCVRNGYVYGVWFVDGYLDFIRDVLIDGIRLWNVDFHFVWDRFFYLHRIRLGYMHWIRAVDRNFNLYWVWYTFLHLDRIWLDHLLFDRLVFDFCESFQYILTTHLLGFTIVFALTVHKRLGLAFLDLRPLLVRVFLGRVPEFLDLVSLPFRKRFGHILLAQVFLLRVLLVGHYRYRTYFFF
ncbi:Uncharacterized protein FWK35_00013179 [Aphis craccivora]|uniref:Uncharacterized protein n=1 Tax=Aphis craccivora TaxID=307492 RepID=A0A6G0YE23_APHCR|nr:Uncharacterized protein FWK35_00013179 [Aphis craccivora]